MIRFSPAGGEEMARHGASVKQRAMRLGSAACITGNDAIGHGKANAIGRLAASCRGEGGGLGTAMECAPIREQLHPAERERWVFSYSVEGDLRFISHRDTLRLFERALTRAALPVKYTEGFNPHARLSIPVPRPVGVASNDESIVVEFEQPVDGEEAARKLGRMTPVGIDVLGARRLGPREQLRPALVRYRLDLTETVDSDMTSRISKVVQASAVEVERTDPKSRRTRSINVRPSIVDIQLNSNGVDFTLCVTSSGTAKPAEIAALLGFDPDSINHRIRRTEIQWQQQQSMTIDRP